MKRSSLSEDVCGFRLLAVLSADVSDDCGRIQDSDLVGVQQ